MGIEIEKKYRLTAGQAEELRARVRAVGREVRGVEFEENTLYAGARLDSLRRVLRLRRVEGRVILTYKERETSSAALKRQREDETEVTDGDALASILEALGYKAALVYEKRRATWQVGEAEVVIDELPFGLFVEIEGEEPAIVDAERLLNLVAVEVVHESYPELTRQLGVKKGETHEARFDFTK